MFYQKKNIKKLKYKVKYKVNKRFKYQNKKNKSKIIKK